MREEQTWNQFLHKYIIVSKNLLGRDYIYSGVLVAVFPDKVLLVDKILGEIPLSFNGLSLVEVKNNCGGDGK